MKALSPTMKWALREGWDDDGIMRIVIGRRGIAHNTIDGLRSRHLLPERGYRLTPVGLEVRKKFVEEERQRVEDFQRHSR